MTEDRCPKNPSLPRAWCSHCQGFVRGTAQNPHFSIKADLYKGSPVVEVLKNGGPIHPWDSHWVLNRLKVRMILASMKLLRRFWQAADDDERIALDGQFVQNEELRIRVCVKMHEDFEDSKGVTVERPWLFLEASPPYKEDVGLGMAKCRAVSATERELAEWLQRYTVNL